jgi:hypothetical protein
VSGVFCQAAGTALQCRIPGRTYRAWRPKPFLDSPPIPAPTLTSTGDDCGPDEMGRTRRTGYSPS